MHHRRTVRMRNIIFINATRPRQSTAQRRHDTAVSCCQFDIHLGHQSGIYKQPIRNILFLIERSANELVAY